MPGDRDLHSLPDDLHDRDRATLLSNLPHRALRMMMCLH